MKRLLMSTCMALILIVLFGYANGVNQGLSDGLLRMHIIANSDSAQDQAYKLEVRNAVMETVQAIVPRNLTKEEARAAILTHQDLVLKSAKEALERQGCHDPVSLSYGKTYFPQKTYAGLRLPAGEYDAFRLQIGQARGQNWWCVVYPSFDSPAEELPDQEGAALLKQQLSSQEYDLITSHSPSVVLRFKTVDYLMQVKEKMKNLRGEL